MRRINANKRAYLQYFIDYHKAKDPEIATLRVEDLRGSRIVVVDPTPILAEELQRTYEWVRSWGMLDETQTQTQLDFVNIEVKNQAPQQPNSAGARPGGPAGRWPGTRQPYFFTNRLRFILLV